MVDPLNSVALSVIRNTASSKAAQSFANSSAAATDAPTFAQTLQGMGQNVVESLENAEKVSMKSLTGGAGPREVAEAVVEAERSLQVSVAIRDKLVTAYLEISRMAI